MRRQLKSNLMKQPYDLIVIGAGVLGSFHAYHAAEKGLRVAVLEKNEAPREATVRNFGQVVPSGMDEQWQTLGRRSLEIYQSIQARCEITVRQNGSIYLASNAEELTLIDELAVLNEQRGYRSERWSTEQCRERYPHLRADYCVGGLFFPDEVSVNPREMIHRLQGFMREQSGIDFFYRTLARELIEGSDGLVTIAANDGQVFQAERVLVCGGHEFQVLYPELFAGSQIQVVKLQMLRLAPQALGQLPGNVLTGLSIRRYESFAECPSYERITGAQDPDVFWKKWGIHLLFKQEEDGSIILGDSHEYASAARPDDLDFDLREEINRYFIEEGQKMMSLPSWEVTSAWYGIYSQTPEEGGLFLRKAGENIHIATAIGGKGMTGSAGFAEKNLAAILS